MRYGAQGKDVRLYNLAFCLCGLHDVYLIWAPREQEVISSFAKGEEGEDLTNAAVSICILTVFVAAWFRSTRSCIVPLR